MNGASATAGPVFIGLPDPDLGPEDREWLAHPGTGGVVLFTRNYESPARLDALVEAIRAVRPELPVAVDQEGGRVQRFREGFAALPPAGVLGRIHERDPAAALARARLTGWVMASELRAAGIDVSFAPVLDLDRGISSVIGDRAFHGDPAVVAQLGLAWAAGMWDAGMPAVGKHFPGHGSVTGDSHAVLPYDERSLAEIAAEDLVPFQRFIAQGGAGLMAAHVVYPEVCDRPAGFSPYWIGEILRRRLGYTGAVLSDDLSMEAARSVGGIRERTTAALQAGCDAVLACEPEAVPEALDAAEGWLAEETEGQAQQRSLRQVRLSARGQPLARDDLYRSTMWQEALARVQAADQAWWA